MMFEKYDYKTLQEMFDGREVSPVLPYDSIDADRDTVTASTQASGRMLKIVSVSFGMAKWPI